MFGRMERWNRRRNRRRGVSPIIATILLVAITVVLAAVLYVLISGLTHTGASTPYSLGMSTPAESNPAAGVYYGVITISPQSGLTTAMFGLAVKTSTGTALAGGTAAVATCKAAAAYSTANCGAPATANWYAVLYWASNATVANVFSGGAWTGATTGVTNSMFLTISSTASLSGTQDYVTVFATGSSSVSGQSGLF